MNNIIAYGSVEGIPLYNCSDHSSEEWSELGGKQWPILGACQLAYGIMIDILYFPILSIIFEKENFKISCFKIMWFLGIIDFLITYVNSILTGWLAMEGAVYCTHPNVIYISGMIVCALWCTSCMTALLLVTNRLLGMTKPALAVQLFDGRKTYIAMIFPFLYFIYFLFTAPLIFNSKYMAWFYEPMIYPERSAEYFNHSHTANNFLIVTLTCIVYTPFRWVIGTNLRHVKSDQSSNLQNTKTQVFLQSTLICAANQVCAVIYVVMNLTTVPNWIIMFAHFTWQFIHGAPVFIYLALNKMIREKFLEKMNVMGSKAGRETSSAMTIVKSGNSPTN
uniref:Serpentine Receptor, class T n=1 Tax=Caenorhabditis japonica TaxID=281687 RepID=A0A8R1DJT3_CAEJA